MQGISQIFIKANALAKHMANNAAASAKITDSIQYTSWFQNFILAVVGRLYEGHTTMPWLYCVTQDMDSCFARRTRIACRRCSTTLGINQCGDVSLKEWPIKSNDRRVVGGICSGIVATPLSATGLGRTASSRPE
jgi:hypothetical protein